MIEDIELINTTFIKEAYALNLKYEPRETKSGQTG